ncbi:inactive rhomboid protein [Pimephales promelas]|nr:inactive rhomboid protein [Pimephales promelas]
MSSEEEEASNSNSGQSESKLKSKKPPSLMIAIPKPESGKKSLRPSLKSVSLQQSSEVLSDSSPSTRDRRTLRRQTSLSQSIRRNVGKLDCEWIRKWKKEVRRQEVRWELKKKAGKVGVIGMKYDQGNGNKKEKVTSHIDETDCEQSMTIVSKQQDEEYEVIMKLSQEGASFGIKCNKKKP